MKWRKRTLIALAAVLVYILSSGPVVGFLAWQPETTNESLAMAVYIFYAPLQFIYIRCPLIGKPLGRYIDLWCPTEHRENEETDSN